MKTSGLRRGSILAAVALVVVLAVAGILSGFASGDPDGLERVADDQGFADTGRESEAIGPLDGYAVNGDDSRLGTGVAGVAGTLTVLVVAGGLAWGVRRRSSSSTGSTADDTATARVHADAQRDR